MSVFKLGKDGSVKQPLYSRVFNASETDEIRLYGQKGTDRFAVSGSQTTSIKVRLIDGTGTDTYTVEGRADKPIIYDLSTEANQLPQPGRAILHMSTDKPVNQFDPHAFNYDQLAPFITAGYDSDDGQNEGRFIEQYVAKQPESSPFLRRKSYGGLQARVLIDRRDNIFLPSRGVYWNTRGLSLWGLGGQNSHITQIQSDLSIHTRFSRSSRLVITNRIGGGLTYGEPAFYQLLYLGGQANLRGFRTYRFAGNHLFYHNVEARLKLFDFQSSLFPASVGLLVFNDVGRVWLKSESS